MVSFTQAVRLGFQQFFIFSGRSTRAEYWWWFLFITMVWIPIGFVVEASLGGSGAIGGIFLLLIFLPTLAVTIRRLHDINRTGWWILLWLVALPIIIGTPIMLAFLLTKGDKGQNRFDFSHLGIGIEKKPFL